MPKSIRSPGLLALGRAIAEFRQSQGLSQEQFAARIGCQQSFVAKVELGVRRLDVVELIVLARGMQVKAVDLLRRVEEATPDSQRI